MAATIKTISDALISRLASSVTGLDSARVAAFSGSLEELAQAGRNLPFAGVSLSEARYGSLNTDNSLAEEHLTFRITVLAEDFRGRRYSLENTYGLVDGIRDALLGETLGLAGIAPFSIKNCIKSRDYEKEGLTVYEVEVATWRVVQQT
ncbi:MAG: hypothetical protein V1794_11930 [Candidatus Glassbacteria bacterium]